MSDRVRARAEFEAPEARFRALVEHNDALITILDENARALYASPSYAWILGYTPDELLGWPNLWPIVHPDDVAWVKEQFAEALRQPFVALPRPLRVVTKAGRLRHAALTITDGRHDPAVGGLIVNGRDVTEELRLNDRLNQALKLEALGQLAGGVAHDFNNLLTVITTCATMLSSEIAPGSEASDDLGEILAAARRGASLTRQLLSFGRRQLRRPRVVDLNETVASTVGMLSRVIGEDITLETELAPDVWPVHADPGQLEQVVMNLAVNARDAMPQGGSLRLRTANVAIDGPTAPTGTGTAPGQFAALVVEDTGTGITSEHLPHLFEPFFTTKDPSKGTGLGLATVYRIIEESGGYVEVDSTIGEGSRFAVYLPHYLGDVEAEPMPERPGIPGGTETILLVEDDASVRAATRRMLERQGYRVFDAASGVEAILRIGDAETHGERIDLVLSDVVMSEPGGRALGEQLAEKWPGLTLIYMSGYTDDEIIRRRLAVPGATLLEKPFTPERLGAVLRHALDQPRPH